MAYSSVINKTYTELEIELIDVYSRYSEYNHVTYGSGKFLDMVNLFASDNFYKLHYVAQEYLKAPIFEHIFMDSNRNIQRESI